VPYEPRIASYKQQRQLMLPIFPSHSQIPDNQISFPNTAIAHSRTLEKNTALSPIQSTNTHNHQFSFEMLLSAKHLSTIRAITVPKLTTITPVPHIQEFPSNIYKMRKKRKRGQMSRAVYSSPKLNSSSIQRTHSTAQVKLISKKQKDTTHIHPRPKSSNTNPNCRRKKQNSCVRGKEAISHSAPSHSPTQKFVIYTKCHKSLILEKTSSS